MELPKKVFWDVSGSDDPGKLLPPMPFVPLGAILIIGGRAPSWRYGMAQDWAFGTDASLICHYDPWLKGGVVIISHIAGIPQGTVIPCEWPIKKEA